MAAGNLFGSESVAAGYREYLEPVIFRPWASRLLDYVGVEPGQAVLDIASGTGVVARAAARRAGPHGRVIASDISAGMLRHVATGLSPDDAPVETLESSATDLRVPDASIDVVLCQQGLPFIPDRVAATVEMRRVLRAGGRVGIAVWLSNPRVEPFIVYGEALAALGLAEPFPHAYDTSATSMSVDEVTEALVTAGFADVEVSVMDYELRWPTAEAAVSGMAGTPYGPVVAALTPAQQDQVRTDLLDRMSRRDGTAVRHRTTAILARGDC